MSIEAIPKNKINRRHAASVDPKRYENNKENMKAMKKRVGSFLCFGPPVTDENFEEKERVEKKNRRIISKIAKSLSFSSNLSNRSEKVPKDPNCLPSREASESSSNQSTSDSFGKNSDSAIFSSSLSSSSSSSSSGLSFDATTSAPEAKPPPKKTFLPPPAHRNNGYATGLCFVLVTLFVMVFCGRLSAILWTATWLCLVPRRRMSGVSPDFSAVAAAVEMRAKRDFKEEEKKRVVLEGFLQRNEKRIDLKRENTKCRKL